MKLLDEMPESGQFVQLHKFGGKVWSNTYKYIDGCLMRYSVSVDEFVEDECDLNPRTNYKYIVDINLTGE